MNPDRVLDASRTVLVTDTAADLRGPGVPSGVQVVPIPVSFGAERVDHLGIAAFYERLAIASDPPTTAQPSVATLADAYRAALAEHETAVVLHLSGRLSGTAEAALAAAAEVDPDRLLVLETEAVSLQLALLCLRVRARLAAGTTAGEVEEFVAGFRRHQATAFSVETLEYLRRGGRLGRGAALAGSLLRVHPILAVTDGEVAPVGRVRGAHRVLPALQAYVAEHTDPGRPLFVTYGHAMRPEAMPALEAAVKEVRPLAVTEAVCEIGPVVGTHAGPGTLAVSVVHDPL